MFEGNASYLYVGNAASTAADAAAIDTIAVGSVAFCTEDGKVEKSATTSGKLRLAQKLASGQMIYSPFFEMGGLLNKNGGAYAAPVQQISYIGYNETDGDLTVAANEDYVVNIEWKNTSGAYNNKPLLLTGMFHTSAASQQELAEGLVASLNGALSRQSYPFVVATAVNDGSGNYGIKLVGAENTKSFDALSDEWSVTSFGILSGDFPESEIRTVTKPSKGSGYYKEVANIEAYAQFLDKASALSAYPQTKIRAEVSSAKTYDICSFDVKELVSTSVGTGLSFSKSFRISIATDVALAGDAINTVLDVTI